MKQFQIAGFPSTGNLIGLPNLQDLLNMPWYQYGDIEQVRRQGGEIYEYLLDKAPMSLGYKYTLVTSRVQFLSPGETAIKYAEDWHSDSNGQPFKSNDLTHLLLSPSSAMTEFNTIPVKTPLLDEDITQAQLNMYINQDAIHLGLKGKRIEPNRFVTFDHSHVHRATSPTAGEFRFMLRIIQTNDYTPSPRSRVTRSYTYRPYVSTQKYLDGTIIENNVAQMPNIDQTPRGVFIYNQGV
jgi:hypothetical protein